MTQIRIERLNTIIEGEKRFYYPYKIYAFCPTCQEEVILRNGTKYDYAMNPIFGRWYEDYQECPQCYTEIKFQMKLDITCDVKSK